MDASRIDPLRKILLGGGHMVVWYRFVGNFSMAGAQPSQNGHTSEEVLFINIVIIDLL